jgi:hypothetical protein
MTERDLPSAIAVLRSTLAGLDELFHRTSITHWRDSVREVAAVERPSAKARAYRSMSAGSASGTFHDLIISVYNNHPITARQEPFVNNLLSTLQSLGIGATLAIERDGDQATLGRPTAEVAAEHWLAQEGRDVRNRWDMIVTGVRCTTCDSRYQLDGSPDEIAARRWSLTTAPARIEAGRSRGLVNAAMDPLRDPHTRTELDLVAPAFEQVDLPVIRLPYNLPDRGPNDRCRVCGADTWTPGIHWRVLDDPLRLEAMPG